MGARRSFDTAQGHREPAAPAVCRCPKNPVPALSLAAASGRARCTPARWGREPESLLGHRASGFSAPRGCAAQGGVHRPPRSAA